MKTERFTVTLDPSIVDKAKGRMKEGEKLSPIINGLLKDWIDEREEEEEILKEYFEG